MYDKTHYNKKKIKKKKELLGLTHYSQAGKPGTKQESYYQTLEESYRIF